MITDSNGNANARSTSAGRSDRAPDRAGAIGSGPVETRPRGRQVTVRPAFPIDHVLRHHTPLIPASTDTIEIPGSDHLALIARFAVAGMASGASSGLARQR